MRRFAFPWRKSTSVLAILASWAIFGMLAGCGKAPSDSTGSNGSGGAGNSGVAADGESGSGAAGKGDGKRPKVAYVTNGIASFWLIGEKGARDAGAKFECDVEIRMPPSEGAVANQKRMIEELLTVGIDGIAVSPIDPDNQTELLNMAAEQTHLITQDADAPNSKRLAYVGLDNYTAGRTCGKLIKEALPDGGSIMFFVGRLEQLNARLRRQGVIDELLDREIDNTRYDEPGQVLKGEKYTILDTRTDNFDFGAAKALAEDALAKHPDLSCMVGLFAYNPPYIIEALRAADKLDKVKVIAFDEDDRTLQAIKDGHVHGTVVQNPYLYGFESVRILAGLTRGDRSVLPEGGSLLIPERVIRKDNVDAFWAELKELTAAAEKPAADGGAAGKPASPPADSGASIESLPKVKMAFVTNNASDFWKIAEAGVRQGEKEFLAECELQLPPNGTADDQQRIIEALIAKGISGMAISPNDAENQVDIINKAAEVMAVITHDSDAPKSKRIAYVGTNNYKAGREAGKLIRGILPDGGKIMLFVGRLDAQNAIDRSNGIKDELAGTKIEILDIRTDLTDRGRAKQNVEDTLTRHPDVSCLVGLWSYNGPAILEAVREADALGKIPIVCFDEEDATLQGVLDGHINATVVQQPYEFGYQSVRILAALARKQDPKLPEGGVVEIPVQVVNKDNVKGFWDRLKRIRSGMAE